MNVDLIRHAPSDANERDVFSGGSETPVSETGKRSAMELSSNFDARAYDRIASSRQSRAVDTATLLFPGARIVIDARLRERSLGEWEGRTKLAMRDLHPDAFLTSGKMHPFFTPPGGETITDVGTRLIEFLEEQTLDGIGRIAVVTHNGVMKTLRVLVEDSPAEKIFAKAEPHLAVRPLTVDRRILDAMRRKNIALMNAMGRE